MRRNHSRLFGFLWMVFLIFLVTLSFIGAYFLTGYLFRIARINLPGLWVQIINSFLGLFITGGVVSFFSRYFRTQQMNAFLPITQALERIARGDFSFQLDDQSPDRILKDLVASVNKTALELNQMETMRQEFISNVSHEIQSPLTSIRGFARALQKDQLSEEDRLHYLEIIETESLRLSRLSDDLLKLASLESDQVKFEPVTYRLDKQIRDVILACEPQWAAKSINLDISLGEVSITADEDLLSQVWLNLVHNSIKFTPTGGEIKVELQAQGDQVIFKIADNGAGIPPEDQAHIFERFYKADKSRTPLKEGSGLGLSIVKKIIDLHQGQINLESSLGAGTTITIELPKK